jgi:predicted nucleic acid-binding protein
MDWLLDTNVVSELRRPRPEPRVLAFVAKQPRTSLYVSDVTLAEIRFGIEVATTPEQAAELRLWLEHDVRVRFASQTLGLSEEILLRWRLLMEVGRKSGRTFPQPDLFLAATALEFGMTLVTRNVKDFAGLELALFNPWEQT